MGAKVKIALVGISGYGDLYLDTLLHHKRAHNVQLVGVVDTVPQRCRHLAELSRRKVPLHSNMSALFRASEADLAIIATPIHLHAPQTCHALRNDVNVLCEKPMAGGLADALMVADVARRSEKLVAFGYQWAFSPLIQQLKRDILNGDFGRPLRLKTIVFFPRPISYFTRNDWVGRIKTATGDWVLDSPVNNATAHYLHNMLYLLGPAREIAAKPATVQIERYRANDIENFDTAAMRTVTEDGVEVLFYTTHAAPERLGPICEYEFERATVTTSWGSANRMVATFDDGTVRRYAPCSADHSEKIWQFAESVQTGRPVACGVDGALPLTLCVAAAHASPAPIAPFPHASRRSLCKDGETFIFIDELAEVLQDCFKRGCLPAEAGKISWAQPAGVVDASASSLLAGEGSRAAVEVSIAALAARAGLHEREINDEGRE